MSVRNFIFFKFILNREYWCLCNNYLYFAWTLYFFFVFFFYFIIGFCFQFFFTLFFHKCVKLGVWDLKVCSIQVEKGSLYEPSQTGIYMYIVSPFPVSVAWRGFYSLLDGLLVHHRLGLPPTITIFTILGGERYCEG